MKFDSETMGFIANLLNQQKAWRLFAYQQWQWIFWVINLFQSFGDTHDRNLAIQAKLFQRFTSTAQLAFASVYDYQLGNSLCSSINRLYLRETISFIEAK